MEEKEKEELPIPLIYMPVRIWRVARSFRLVGSLWSGPSCRVRKFVRLFVKREYKPRVECGGFGDRPKP